MRASTQRDVLRARTARWSTGPRDADPSTAWEVEEPMTMATTSSGGIVDRMMRAAKLEVPLYEEVEADTTATSQALTVVIAVAVATGIGQALGATMANQGTSGLIGGLISGV